MKLAFQLCALFAVTSFLVRGASLPEGKLARAQHADEEPVATEEHKTIPEPVEKRDAFCEEPEDYCWLYKQCKSDSNADCSDYERWCRLHGGK